MSASESYLNDNTHLTHIFFDNCAAVQEIMSLHQELIQIIFKQAHDLYPTELLQINHSQEVFQKFFTSFMSQPENLFLLNSQIIKSMSDMFIASTSSRYAKDDDDIDDARKKKNERIFSSEIWNLNPFYNYIKNIYIFTEKLFLNCVESSGCDRETKAQLIFYVDIYLSTISPINFVNTNPDAIEEINKTGGKNLLDGYINFLKDLIHKNGQLSVTLTDQSAFKLGKNIACTPGKIVMQNDLIQLIQYTPTTKTVYPEPIIIVPPFINKYYILDLSPHNSLVKWLVEQGYVVYMLSWVNPDSSLANKDFEDYMLEGPVAAINFLKTNTKFKKFNVCGYCIGGTLLACTLSYLKKTKEDCIKSSTFLMTLLDFSNIGELGAFIDDRQVDSLSQLMDKKGYLDGRLLNLVFNLIRPYDLIWPHIVNNYLIGRRGKPFDILYWNSDPTNLPKKMYEHYLREFCLNNKLVEDNQIVLNDIPINLGDIDVPCFFLASDADHITPWNSVYQGALKINSPVNFMLSKSGHVRAVVNPSPDKKYGYFSSTKSQSSAALPNNPSDWLSSAEHSLESWWIPWDKWLQGHCSNQIESKELDDLKCIEDAPGNYVQKRL